MAAINTDLLLALNTSLELELPEKISYEEVHTLLANHVNHLIKNNFDSLLTLLYRIDVDEEKLKHFLIEKPEDDAANTIAALIIERQQQKINFKKQFSNKNDVDSTEEKW
jgi:hypothetical protein